MNSAENPQPDMLRINNETARNILACSDADIYKLTPAGTEKLTTIEALRPMCFLENRELAIKNEDIGGLDKWAQRTVKSMHREIRREERAKNKNNREEL
jgi:hypothetical protein